LPSALSAAVPLLPADLLITGDRSLQGIISRLKVISHLPECQKLGAARPIEVQAEMTFLAREVPARLRPLHFLVALKELADLGTVYTTIEAQGLLTGPRASLPSARQTPLGEERFQFVGVPLLRQNGKSCPRTLDFQVIFLVSGR
jgi:hypothetical protein